MLCHSFVWDVALDWYHIHWPNKTCYLASVCLWGYNVCYTFRSCQLYWQRWKGKSDIVKWCSYCVFTCRPHFIMLLRDIKNWWVDMWDDWEAIHTFKFICSSAIYVRSLIILDAALKPINYTNTVHVFIWIIHNLFFIMISIKLISTFWAAFYLCWMGYASFYHSHILVKLQLHCLASCESWLAHGQNL